MPITSRLLEKANSTPNSGLGSTSAPDASIKFFTGYNNINWTSLDNQGVKTNYEYYLNNSSSVSLNYDTYYYNSNIGFAVGTKLCRNVAGNYNNPTDPSNGCWLYKYGSVTNIINVTSSLITAITPYNSFNSSSNVNINLCAPTSSASTMVIYAYAVTGSTPIAVNIPVTVGFYWSGSGGGLLSGSLTIPQGSTCVSSSFSFTSQSVVSFTYSGSISPFITGSYTYTIGSTSTSNSCTSCP